MSEKIFLTEPDIAYKETFTEMVKEYIVSGEELYIEIYGSALEDFDKYLERLRKHAEGIDIPENWVPSHSYWLTNEDKKILGVIRVRTKLEGEYVTKYYGNIGYDISPSSRGRGYGMQILKLGLEKAREIGLKRVLITCSEENIASRKIIEANGGVYEYSIAMEEHGEVYRRYWIEL